MTGWWFTLRLRVGVVSLTFRRSPFSLETFRVGCKRKEFSTKRLEKTKEKESVVFSRSACPGTQTEECFVNHLACRLERARVISALIGPGAYRSNRTNTVFPLCVFGETIFFFRLCIYRVTDESNFLIRLNRRRCVGDHVCSCLRARESTLTPCAKYIRAKEIH